jgi:hypothetical protein
MLGGKIYVIGQPFGIQFGYSQFHMTSYEEKEERASSFQKASSWKVTFEAVPV